MIKQRFGVGDEVVMSSDALENYGNKYDGVVFVVVHAATKYMPAKEFFAKGQPTGYHPGYDEGCGSALYDLALKDGKNFGNALYDWELEWAPKAKRYRR